jgi:PTH1 family peptidyl-tRNA hydrolase
MLPSTKVLIGLGNVGERYANNRHNAGFIILDELQGRDRLKAWGEKSRLSGSISENQSELNKFVLVKPSTMMNDSGRAAAAISQFYRTEPEDVVVIYDDVDLEFGTVKVQFGGGSAGHNGIKSISSHIGEEYWRIRIGVKNDILKHQDTADFVLSNFSKDEQAKLLAGYPEIETLISSFIAGSLEATSLQI